MYHKCFGILFQTKQCLQKRKDVFVGKNCAQILQKKFLIFKIFVCVQNYRSLFRFKLPAKQQRCTS